MAHDAETRKQVYESKIKPVLGTITEKWASWLDADEPVRFWVRHDIPTELSVIFIFKSQIAHNKAIKEQILDEIRVDTWSGIQELNKTLDDEPIQLETPGFLNRTKENAEAKRRVVEDFYDDLARKAAREAIAAYKEWFPNTDFPVVMYGIAPERVTHFIFATRERQAAANAASIPAALEASMIDAVAKVNQTHDKKPMVIFIGFANSEDITEAGGPYNYFR